MINNLPELEFNQHGILVPKRSIEYPAGQFDDTLSPEAQKQFLERIDEQRVEEENKMDSNKTGTNRKRKSKKKYKLKR